MSIVLTRVDNRLIHGQVVTNWLRSCKANICIVANDRVAKDPVEQRLLSMAVADMMPIRFFDVETAAGKIAGADPRRNIAIVVENPIDALKLIEFGAPIESINIGNMHMADGKEKLCMTVYAGPEERAAIASLLDRGIEVEYRLLPSDPPQNLRDALNHSNTTQQTER